jgi:hypothetical protein
LICLSSIKSLPENIFSNTQSSQTETLTQVSEDDENGLHEFRESVKINFSGGVKTRSNHFTSHSNLFPNSTQYTQYTSYLQKQSAKPSQKLFIDFQVLII